MTGTGERAAVAPGRRRVTLPLGAAALAPAVLATAFALVRGTDPPVATQVVLLVVAFAAYGLLLAVAARHPPPLGAVIAAGLVLLALAVAVPPSRSGDIRSYAMYGRIVAHHGANPYLHPPSAFRRDPLLARMDERWRDTPSVYGPAFTAVSAGVMAGAGTSPLRIRLAFQLLAALATAATVALLAGRVPTALLAAVACNPVLVLSVVNGGHNDALVGLAVVAGCVLAGGRRYGAAGTALALGALVKIVALLPLAAVAAWVLHQRGRAAALRVAATGALTVTTAYLLAGGPDALEPLRSAGLQTSRASLWDGIRHELTHDLVAEGWRGLDAGLEVRSRLAPLVVLTIVLVAGLLVASRLRDRDPSPAAGASLVAYLLAGAYVLPWYAGFALPVAALARWNRLVALVAVHTGLLLLVYVPWPEPDVDPVQRLLRDVYGVWIPILVVLSVLVMGLRAAAELVRAGRSAAATRPSPRPHGRRARGRRLSGGAPLPTSPPMRPAAARSHPAGPSPTARAADSETGHFLANVDPREDRGTSPS